MNNIRISVLFLSFLLLFCMCAEEKDEVIRKKLDVILQDDLNAILDGVSTDALLDKPHYTMVEYKSYDEGDYSKLAIVDFYFLKKINMKITRKYRYYKPKGLWDRYFNKYMVISADSNETAN